MAGGGHLRVARALAHPKQQVAAAGVAGIFAGDDPGGHRSSAEVEHGASGHGEARGVAFWTPASVVRAVVCSEASLRGCGHGYAMAGGEEQSAPVTRAARGCVRARGTGEKKAELTAGSETVSASSGRRRRRQIDGGDPRWPRRGTAKLAASRASGAFRLGEEEEGDGAELLGA